MKIKNKILISLLVFLILIVPIFSFAQTTSTGLVPCNNSATQPCNFSAFITLINHVIKFILFTLVVPICAVMFFYAGFLMVTSGGSAESKSKAKNIFSSAVYGLVIAAGAWLIIHTILTIVSPQGTWSWIGF